jgi:uncharacterized repeat protein (TIGR03803 family)
MVTLYGTTEAGGHKDNGVVYSISTTGAKKVLYRFRGYQNGGGSIPAGDLIDVNGTLYGTTYGGGFKSGCRGSGCGTIFALTP